MDNKVIIKHSDDSFDDGYIDDEVEITTLIEETVEIEDVSEKIEQEDEKDNNEKETMQNEKYSKEDFHDESEDDLAPSEEAKEPIYTTSNEKLTKHKKASKPMILRPKSSKVNPCGLSSEDGDQPKILRKTCCDYKGSDEYKQKLPKYNGFNSNYGLSKEEIEKREHTKLSQRQHKELRTIRQMEQKEFVSSLNEEAFSKW